MRGLAFPTNTPHIREPSQDQGTPFSNPDNIPIDPALGGPPIDPPVDLHGTGVITGASPSVLPLTLPEEHTQHAQVAEDEYKIRQYSQGPQGDPFAPNIAAPYFAFGHEIEHQQMPVPPPKPKRRRKIIREEECSFCQGNEEKNKRNEPEMLITCSECGRSGHPSCMQLEKIRDVVISYPWKCIECKNCEVCKEKGDDDRILFCDWCDRGWHMDCMQPPIQQAPEGLWRCPACPEDGDEEHNTSMQHQHSLAFPGPVNLDQTYLSPRMREDSVASTSKSAREGQPAKSRKLNPIKGKARPRVKVIIPTDSEDDDPQPRESISAPRARGRPPRLSASTKGKARAASSDNDIPTTQTRTVKRRRLKDGSPGPSAKPTAARSVRLRLPTNANRSGGTGLWKGKGKDRERDEDEQPNHGLFDDILDVDERDASKTTPLNIDKVYFEKSRLAAEVKLVPPAQATPSTALGASSSTSTSRTTARALAAAAAAAAAAADESEPVPQTRPLRSSTLQNLNTPKRSDSTSFSFNSPGPGPSTPSNNASAAQGQGLAKLEPGVLRICTIRFGPYDIKTWYDAPFPEEYASIPDGRLWICEFCLKYMKSRYKAIRHQCKCKVRHPPGDEIYRDGNVSIFEVDGRRNKIYCQNLCLLSKMFLDHKSLFYDVEPFLFYVITQVDDFGARFVGYFSKEKRCPKDFNLSCIMTLPVRQRQGWGNLLIDFSYLLSKIEQRTGSPEKPLSSLGALGYRNYWMLSIMRYLEKAPDSIRLEDISTATSMTIEDICGTLTHLGMISIRESTPPPIRPSPGQSIKYPKGRKNGLGRRHLLRLQERDSPGYASPGGTNGYGSPGVGGGGGHGKEIPFVPPKEYEISFDRDKVQAYLRAWEAKGYLTLKSDKLQWTPYLVTRTDVAASGEALDMPAMDTVLPSTTATTSVSREESTSKGTSISVNGVGRVGSLMSTPHSAEPESVQEPLPEPQLEPEPSEPEQEPAPPVSVHEPVTPRQSRKKNGGLLYEIFVDEEEGEERDPDEMPMIVDEKEKEPHEENEHEREEDEEEEEEEQAERRTRKGTRLRTQAQAKGKEKANTKPKAKEKKKRGPPRKLRSTSASASCTVNEAAATTPILVIATPTPPPLEPSPTPPPAVAAPRTRRTRSNNQTNIPSSPLETTTTNNNAGGVRMTRKLPTRRSTRNAHNDEDEALATKLAMEEHTGGRRQLRSGAKVDIGKVVASGRGRKKAVHAPSTRESVIKSRKRKRIESSPEVEEVEEEVDVEVLKKEEEEEEEEIRAASDAPMEIDGEVEVMETKMNGHQHKINGHSTHPLSVVTPEEDVRYSSALETDAHASVMQMTQTIKCEESATPVARLESVPSDDTVYIVPPAMMKGKYAEYQGPMHAESDLRSTLRGEDDLHDEDADGEDESDSGSYTMFE